MAFNSAGSKVVVVFTHGLDTTSTEALIFAVLNAADGTIHMAGLSTIFAGTAPPNTIQIDSADMLYVAYSRFDY